MHQAAANFRLLSDWIDESKHAKAGAMTRPRKIDYNGGRGFVDGNGCEKGIRAGGDSGKLGKKD